MSSTETLNFGPEWLRALSGGTNITSPPPSPAAPCAVKFKLAEFRYGREEMLALFAEDPDVPSAMLLTPSLVSEKVLVPLALLPLTPDDHKNLSGSLNSEVHYNKPRVPVSRGRSVTLRGRGRGRGESYPRSLSVTDDSSSSFARVGPKDYSRRESWDDKAFSRNGRAASEEVFSRKPFRRSDASDDWRSDVIRGSGDGGESDKFESSADWHPPGPVRKNSWRGRSNASNWRTPATTKDRLNDDLFPLNESGPPTRSHSMDVRFDVDFARMPEWAEEADDTEVGVFDSSGAFKLKSVDGPSTLPAKQPADGARPVEQSVPPVEQEQQPTVECDELPKQSVNDSNKGAVEDRTDSAEQVEAEDLHHLEQAALQLVDSLSECDDWADIGQKAPITPETRPQVESTAANDPTEKWFYKDPQGETQGPFTSQEMREWFLAGYFTVSLLIKRACDPHFMPLGDAMLTSQGTLFGLNTYVQPKVPEQLVQATNYIEPQPPSVEKQQTQPKQQKMMHPTQSLFSYQGQHNQLNTTAPQVHSSKGFPEPQISRQKDDRVQHIQTEVQSYQQDPMLPSHLESPTPAPVSVWNNRHQFSAKPPIDPVVLQTQSTVQELEERLLKSSVEANVKNKMSESAMTPKQPITTQTESHPSLTKKVDGGVKEATDESRTNMKQKQQKKLSHSAVKEQHKQEQAMQEEEKKKQVQMKRAEEEKKRAEEEKKRRAEEEKKRRAEEEKKRKAEEEKKRRAEEEKKRRAEEQEKIKKQRIEKQAEEEALRKQKALQIQMQKDELNKKKQQEQLRNIKLPSNTNWAQQQQLPSALTSSSVIEIQKMQEEKELFRRRQEQLQALQQQQQRHLQDRQRPVWGGNTISHIQTTSPTISTLSLAQIQEEEAQKQRSVKKQTQIHPKPPSNVVSSSTVWGATPVKSTNATSMWDAQPERTTAKTRAQYPTAKGDGFGSAQRPEKAEKRSTGGYPKSSNLINIFQQQQTVDPLVAWCQEQLKGFPAAANLDIPTFVAFLCDVESPYDVKDYVTSYLGESKKVQSFAEAFLLQRSAAKKQRQLQESSSSNAKVLDSSVSHRPASTAVTSSVNPTEFVTGNTKRGKRKQRKLQKVDPSILGFSVNAASDRVNSGEIEMPDHR